MYGKHISECNGYEFGQQLLHLMLSIFIQKVEYICEKWMQDVYGYLQHN